MQECLGLPEVSRVKAFVVARRDMWLWGWTALAVSWWWFMLTGALTPCALFQHGRQPAESGDIMSKTDRDMAGARSSSLSPVPSR
jgi:hypothetical protein